MRSTIFVPPAGLLELQIFLLRYNGTFTRQAKSIHECLQCKVLGKFALIAQKVLVTALPNTRDSRFFRQTAARLAIAR